MAYFRDLIDILTNNRAGVEPRRRIGGYCPRFTDLKTELVHEDAIRDSEARHYEYCLAIEAGMREFGCLHGSEYFVFAVEFAHGRPD